jgi:hypothetical protein
MIPTDETPPSDRGRALLADDTVVRVVVPVSYDIRGTLAGNKAPRQYRFVEFAEIDIEQVSSADAPVSVSWNFLTKPNNMRVDYLNHFEIRSWDVSGRNHCVYHGGRHWLRLLELHTGKSTQHNAQEGSSPIRFEGFASRTLKGEFNGIFSFSKMGAVDHEIVSSDPTPRFSDIKENGRARAFRSLARLSLISVDGVVHMAGDQPTIAYASADADWVATTFPYVTCRRRALRDNPSTPETLFFPLSVTPAPLPLDGLDFEIHLPHAMSADDDAEVAADYNMQALASAVKRARTRRYPDLTHYFELPDTEAKAAFIERVLEVWPSDRGGLDTQPLVEALAFLDNRDISFGRADGLMTLPSP